MLDVSVDVDSDNEETGLNEAKHKYDEYGLVDCWLHVMDGRGKVHKINVHNYKISLCKFIS